MSNSNIVWLIEERTFGEIVNLGAFFSTIRYAHGGIDYEVLMDNNDFEYHGDEDDDD